MNQGKQPNELSKLLKDNETPQIIYQEVIYRRPQGNKFIWFISKINENFFLLVLLILLLLFIIIYLLLVSIKSKKDILNDYKGDYNINQNKYNSQYSSKRNFSKVNISNLYNETKMCTENKKFAILSRTNCEACGLFSYYIVHLGCIITFLNEGYIPIIDVSSFTNVFNGYDKYNDELLNYTNQWEFFFNQPCGYTLKDMYENNNTTKYNITYFECECSDNMPSEKEVYSNQTLLRYYRDMANKYMSVKRNILDDANIIWEKLFGNSKNVLGVLVRGTDYISIKPYHHSIPPSAEMAINDTKKMDSDNKYDYIFLATEDIKIRNKFINEFGDKLKYLDPDTKIDYDYDEGNYLSFHKDVFGNMNFHKIYLLSMIILSRCLDIISSRTSGAAGAFIFSKGFRKDLVYYIGEYEEY